MKFDLATVKTLISLMEAHGLTELEVEEGGHKVRLAKAGSPTVVAASPVQAPMPLGVPPGTANGTAYASPAAPQEDLYTFPSPLVGTFYRASAPDAAPYASVGDTVSEDTVLCIVEAMKVMNEIKAELKGEVREVLVANGEAVEYGQPLFLIKRLS